MKPRKPLKKTPAQKNPEVEPAEVELVLPHGMMGAPNGYLIEAVVRAIASSHGKEGDWADKYGTDVETDQFVMRRFCYCESESCPTCGMDAPNFHYKPTDFRLWWYKFIGRDHRVNREPSAKECAEMLLACLKPERRPRKVAPK